LAGGKVCYGSLNVVLPVGHKKEWASRAGGDGPIASSVPFQRLQSFLLRELAGT
jgi:hypothetical protein